MVLITILIKEEESGRGCFDYICFWFHGNLRSAEHKVLHDFRF